MSKRHLLLLAFALSPLAVLGACSGDDNKGDAGSDASKDATLDGKTDGGTDAKPDVVDAHVDAPNDAPSDAVSDATTDATTDAGADATADASDAGSDASSDAADAGSSWHTATIDGVISTGEYGDAQNETASGNSHWFVTWDATYLYVAVDNANVGEGTVLYVGYSGNGITTAQVYDSTGGTLPFAADGVVYAKSTYNEVRVVNGTTWGAPSTAAITYKDDGNTTREEAIPWTALGATSIPASFRFLAYATSGTGFIYAQIPTTNPGGQADAGLTFAHDFYVTSTANGTGAFPFDLTE